MITCPYGAYNIVSSLVSIVCGSLTRQMHYPFLTNTARYCHSDYTLCDATHHHSLQILVLLQRLHNVQDQVSGNAMRWFTSTSYDASKHLGFSIQSCQIPLNWTEFSNSLLARNRSNFVRSVIQHIIALLEDCAERYNTWQHWEPVEALWC